MKESVCRKILALSLSALMLGGTALPVSSVSAAAASTSAVQTVTGSYQYTVNQDGTLTITAYSGQGGKVTIPDKIDGKVVSALGQGVFQESDTLTEIVMPDTVKKIGFNTFAYCTKLTKVTMPKYITEIGTGAFNGCKSITSITLPETLTTLKKYAFSGCSALKSVVIPSKITILDFSMFEGCSSLRCVKLPSGMKEIYANAFGRCTSLVSVFLPQSVQHIYGLAFCGCRQLTNVTVTNTSAYIDKIAFDECSKLTLYGQKGSTAESFSKQTGIPFSSQPAPALSLSTVMTPVVKVGETVTIKAKAIDGIAPYQFAVYYRFSQNDSWITAQNFSPNSNVQFIPKTAGRYTILVKVKDAANRITQTECSVQVNAAPLANKSRLSTTSVKVGQPVKVLCQAIGGGSGYQYYISSRKAADAKWTTLMDYSTAGTLTITPKTATTYYIKVRVKDALNKVAVRTLTLKAT